MARNRYALPSVVISLLCALLSYGLLLSTQRDADTEFKYQQRLHVQLVLSSVYELHGSWGDARPALVQLPLVRDYTLSLWSSTGEPVISGNDFDERERRALLHDGQIIGSYAATLPPFPDPSTTLMPALGMGFTAGLAAWFIMQRRGAAHDQDIQHIARTLQFESPPASTSKSNTGERDAEAIQTAIARLHERVERLETVRKSMVADIAHELRTPLTVLRAKLERSLQLQSALHPEELVPLMDEVYRMSKLLQDLQQLALAESGHLLLDKRWFPLQSMLVKLTELIQLEAEASGVELTCQFKDTAMIYADENRLRQVLLNLLGNALRHARTRVILSVACTELVCTLEIIDDGTGIEPEELPRLFDRFYRGSRSASSHSVGPAPGLGLGLAIAKGLAEAHGGSIEVESQWGQGTTFRVCLPIFREN